MPQLCGRSKLTLCIALVVLACSGAQDGSEKPVAGQSAPSPRILRLEELSNSDLERLDRSRSIFFLAFGNLEEHGPHLPIGTDSYESILARDGLIRALSTTHPEYKFILVPMVPLGEGGANELAGQAEHLGTFAVRFETLRDVAIDLGASIARKGFQTIFVIHEHGMILSNLALNQAAAFVSQRYGVRMVNLSSLLAGQTYWDDPVWDTTMTKYLGKGWETKGWESHGGIHETSVMLYSRPDLVKAGYRSLAPFFVRPRIANRDTRLRRDWKGYWGDPARATAELGRHLSMGYDQLMIGIAEKVLAGTDPNSFPIFPDSAMADDWKEIVRASTARYAAEAGEIEAWLRRQPSFPPKRR